MQMEGQWSRWFYNGNVLHVLHLDVTCCNWGCCCSAADLHFNSSFQLNSFCWAEITATATVPLSGPALPPLPLTISIRAEGVQLKCFNYFQDTQMEIYIKNESDATYCVRMQCKTLAKMFVLTACAETKHETRNANILLPPSILNGHWHSFANNTPDIKITGTECPGW